MYISGAQIKTPDGCGMITKYKIYDQYYNWATTGSSYIFPEVLSDPATPYASYI